MNKHFISLNNNEVPVNEDNFLRFIDDYDKPDNYYEQIPLNILSVDNVVMFNLNHDMAKRLCNLPGYDVYNNIHKGLFKDLSKDFISKSVYKTNSLATDNISVFTNRLDYYSLSKLVYMNVLNKLIRLNYQDVINNCIMKYESNIMSQLRNNEPIINMYNSILTSIIDINDKGSNPITIDTVSFISKHFKKAMSNNTNLNNLLNRIVFSVSSRGNESAFDVFNEILDYLNTVVFPNHSKIYSLLSNKDNDAQLIMFDKYIDEINGLIVNYTHDLSRRITIKDLSSANYLYYSFSDSEYRYKDYNKVISYINPDTKDCNNYEDDRAAYSRIFNEPYQFTTIELMSMEVISTKGSFDNFLSQLAVLMSQIFELKVFNDNEPLSMLELDMGLQILNNPEFIKYNNQSCNSYITETYKECSDTVRKGKDNQYEMVTEMSTDEFDTIINELGDSILDNIQASIDSYEPTSFGVQYFKLFNTPYKLDDFSYNLDESELKVSEVLIQMKETINKVEQPNYSKDDNSNDIYDSPNDIEFDSLFLNSIKQIINSDCIENDTNDNIMYDSHTPYIVYCDYLSVNNDLNDMYNVDNAYILKMLIDKIAGANITADYNNNLIKHIDNTSSVKVITLFKYVYRVVQYITSNIYQINYRYNDKVFTRFKIGDTLIPKCYDEEYDNESRFTNTVNSDIFIDLFNQIPIIVNTRSKSITPIISLSRYLIYLVTGSRGYCHNHKSINTILPFAYIDLNKPCLEAIDISFINNAYKKLSTYANTIVDTVMCNNYLISHKFILRADKNKKESLLTMILNYLWSKDKIRNNMNLKPNMINDVYLYNLKLINRLLPLQYNHSKYDEYATLYLYDIPFTIIIEKDGNNKLQVNIREFSSKVTSYVANIKNIIVDCYIENIYQNLWLANHFNYILRFIKPLNK